MSCAMLWRPLVSVYHPKVQGALRVEKCKNTDSTQSSRAKLGCNEMCEIRQ